MSSSLSRRSALKTMAALAGTAAVGQQYALSASAATRDPRWDKAIDRGLKWDAKTQSAVDILFESVYQKLGNKNVSQLYYNDVIIS